MNARSAWTEFPASSAGARGSRSKNAKVKSGGLPRMKATERELTRRREMFRHVSCNERIDFIHRVLAVEARSCQASLSIVERCVSTERFVLGIARRERAILSVLFDTPTQLARVSALIWETGERQQELTSRSCRPELPCQF